MNLEHASVYEFFNPRRTPSHEDIMRNIRLDCYVAIIGRMREAFPRAHFEIITRREENSTLSPSMSLAWIWSARKITFNGFSRMFLAELKTRPEALEALRRLHAIAERQLVFLVCYERDSKQCHRSLVKEYIMKYGGTEHHGTG